MPVRRFRRLFAAVDTDGLTLPPEVGDARDADRRVLAALAELTPPDPAGAVFAAAVAATLTAADPLADALIAPVLDHAAAEAAHTARLAVLRQAAEQAENMLGVAIADHGDQIITEHIAAAGEALWAEVTAAVTALGDIDPANMGALLNAPTRARRAYLDLDALAARYSRLWEAWTEIPDQAAEHDVHGDHREYRAGMCTIAGPGWRGHAMAPTTPRMPWPDDARGRFVWLVRHNIAPWWPTAEQRDEAWMDVHRDQHQQMVNQRRRSNDARAYVAAY